MSEAQSKSGMVHYIPLLTVLLLGMSLAVLNQTLLNVAIPHLINEFNTTASTAEWLMTGYMLVNGVLVPLAPFLIERLGIRRLFLFSMILFTIGALLCGIATNFSVMLIGRLVQAVGAGILMPLVMTIILGVFPPEIRGKGMGILGLAMTFAPAVGPTLSGWVIENYNWRFLFNGIVPLGILVIILALFLIKDTKKPTKVKFNYTGAILSTIGFGSLLYGLSEAGSSGWSDVKVLAFLTVGFFMILLFVLTQLRSNIPLLDLRVFRYDVYALSSLINVIITLAMFSGMFLLPIYLQNLRGFTPFESGLLMLPGAIIMGVMSPISGALFDRFGPRILSVVGMIITTVTTYEFAKLSLDTSYNHILMINMIRSFGMSLLMMPIMTAGLNQLPMDRNSHGTAMSNTLRSVAGSMGISLMTSIFSNRTVDHMGALTSSLNTMDPVFSQSLQQQVVSVSQATGLPAAQAQQTIISNLVGQVSQQASVMGINDAFLWATGISFVGLILCFFLRDVRKDKVHEKETTQEEHSDETAKETKTFDVKSETEDAKVTEQVEKESKKIAVPVLQNMRSEENSLA